MWLENMKLVQFSAIRSLDLPEHLKKKIYCLVARILSPKYIAFFRLSRINNFSGISLRPHKNSSGRKIVAHISGARRVLSIADSLF
jgi:hypothetical protein